VHFRRPHRSTASPSSRRMATKEMPQETYDFSFYYTTTNVLAKLHSSRSTTLHRSRIFLTPFCKPSHFSRFFPFLNETQRIDIIFLSDLSVLTCIIHMYTFIRLEQSQKLSVINVLVGNMSRSAGGKINKMNNA